MRAILTGGGTGGHIYPAIAIADEIKRRNKDAEILFVGTKHGIEKDIVPANGYNIEFISVRGFDRKHILKNVKTLTELSKGMLQSKKLIKEFKPDFVIGTGGYVCGPVVREAARVKVPAYIHEQNAFPGMTNRMLSKHVNCVFIAFGEAAKYFKTRNEIMITGNPVRSAFAEIRREEARRELGIAPDEFVVLSFGGSLGAAKINAEMEYAVDKLRNVEKLRIIFVTGKSHYDEVISKMGDRKPSNVDYLRYLDDMPRYLNACDLAITRSGALTVSEITGCGVPSIMIPSPNVTQNHQYFNAKVVADRGGSILIEEKDLKESSVAEKILYLFEHRENLKKMKRAAADLAKMDAAEVICDKIGI